MSGQENSLVFCEGEVDVDSAKFSPNAEELVWTGPGYGKES
jgi:hypothetical protein